MNIVLIILALIVISAIVTFIPQYFFYIVIGVILVAVLGFCGALIAKGW